MKPVPTSYLARVLVVIAAGLALAGCPQQPPVPPPGGVGPLNDTGVTTCGDADSHGLSCASVPAFPGQDGQFGRDLTANNDSDGHAGFHFTKLGANGQPLAIQHGAWSDNGSEGAGTRWSCVRDEVTGRTWEVKDNDPNSLHYREHTYSWYSPDASTRGGFAGTPGAGACNGTLPVSGQYTGCDTYTFPRYINDNGGLCGFKDWRVPEIQELRSIVDYSVAYPGPTIDNAYFPNSTTNMAIYRAHWTATPRAITTLSAWTILFVNGTAGGWGKDGALLATLLVRGGQ